MTTPFITGQYVSKVGGDYRFDGVVVSVFQKLSGQTRYVVEDDRGVLHIYSDKNLKAQPNKSIDVVKVLEEPVIATIRVDHLGEDGEKTEAKQEPKRGCTCGDARPDDGFCHRMNGEPCYVKDSRRYFCGNHQNIGAGECPDCVSSTHKQPEPETKPPHYGTRAAAHWYEGMDSMIDTLADKELYRIGESKENIQKKDIEIAKHDRDTYTKTPNCDHDAEMKCNHCDPFTGIQHLWEETRKTKAEERKWREELLYFLEAAPPHRDSVKRVKLARLRERFLPDQSQ